MGAKRQRKPISQIKMIEDLDKWTSSEIKRTFGIDLSTLRAIHILSELNLDNLLLTFYWMKECPTFLSLGSTFGKNKQTANEIVHNTVENLLEKLPELIEPELRHEIEDDFKSCKVVVDVTKLPVAEPVALTIAGKYRSKLLYSGMDEMHCLKIQAIVGIRSGLFYDLATGVGSKSDLRIWKESGSLEYLNLKNQEHVAADLGYLGDYCFVVNEKSKVKNSKAIICRDKDFKLRRGIVERVFGRIKRFNVLQKTYRGSLLFLEKIFAVIAKIHNIEIYNIFKKSGIFVMANRQWQRIE